MSSSSASSKPAVIHSTASSVNRSVNGSVQNPSRSKGPAKRSVTPNSRSHSASSYDCDGSTNTPNRRSVTPISRSHAHHGKDNDPLVVVKTAPAGSKRSVTPISRNDSIIVHDPEPGRVRVTVRLRPRNAEDLASDADYADCVELQPELKKLKLRKNNWSSESYKFDEVFTETASQKRIYEVVAKPVVESVLSGYNGTVMAYGQTGTGKTYTVGNLGKDDASERGIMVRAVEDILANASPDLDSVEFSYLQLYMESVQDLLSPEKINIPIVEDAKTGEVSLPGAEVVNIQELDHFLDLLQKGEANRHAANTNMNTNSSRSHAILMVYIRRSFAGRTDADTGSPGLRTIRKSKLLIVDLAGSERIDKSGSEGHLLEEAKFINLSLTSLGKCINALAENSPHIPTRESKLTRLLRDSFGGSARTSLIITIGPSARNHAETTSTVMFGQRAMKIVNMMKLKEEFDYESFSRKLESQVDHLTKEIDRQQKLQDTYANKMEKKLKECQLSFSETEKSLVARSETAEKKNTCLTKELEIATNDLSQQKDCNKLLRDEIVRLEMSIELYKQKQQESSIYQKTLTDTTQMYEKQIAELIKQVENERSNCESAERQVDAMRRQLSDHEKTIQQHQMEYSSSQTMLSDTEQTFQKKIVEITKQLEYEQTHRMHAEGQVESLNKLLSDVKSNQGREQILVSELRAQIEEMDSKEKSEVAELRRRVEELEQLHQRTVKELELLRVEYSDLSSEKEKLKYELDTTRDKLLVEEKQRMTLENDLVKMKKLVGENNEDAVGKRMLAKQQLSRGSSSFRSVMGLPSMVSSQRAALAQFCEDVGLEKIVSLLSSDDPNAQMYAIKVVANLAADDLNLDKIVNEGGLEALLKILETSRNITILRVACGAIANLAMNETNQALIMSKKGSKLLASTASRTDDPQTLRMVAGAIANLCGNVKLHMTLNQDGCIKALLGMARSKNAEVVAQVARALSNIAKSEPRGTLQGHRSGRSLLMEEGAFTWLIENSNVHSSDSSQRHIELALCHLAQVEENTQDFISAGGLKELITISSKSAREDIRNLATNTVKLNPSFESRLRNGADIS